MLQEIIHGIYQFLGDGLNSNCYILKSDSEGLIIDSGLGNFWQSNYAQKRFNDVLSKFPDISSILLTHAHLDHVGGVLGLGSELRNKIKIIAHEIEKKYLEIPDKRYIDPIFGNKSIRKILVDNSVKHGEILEFGDFKLEIIHTPGHTEGSICIYDPKRKILFSGDTVFPEGSFGRVDFYKSNPEALVHSLELLTSYDVDFLLAGHMPPITRNANSSIRMSYSIAKNYI